MYHNTVRLPLIGICSCVVRNTRPSSLNNAQLAIAVYAPVMRNNAISKITEKPDSEEPEEE